MGWGDDGFSGEGWNPKPEECPKYVDPDHAACKECGRKQECVMEAQAKLTGYSARELDANLERDAKRRAAAEKGAKMMLEGRPRGGTAVEGEMDINDATRKAFPDPRRSFLDPENMDQWCQFVQLFAKHLVKYLGPQTPDSLARLLDNYLRWWSSD